MKTVIPTLTSDTIDAGVGYIRSDFTSK